MSICDDYAAGFERGECARYLDRQAGRIAARPPVMHNENMRGFWDGYTPRSIEWAMRSTQQNKPFCEVD